MTNSDLMQSRIIVGRPRATDSNPEGSSSASHVSGAPARARGADPARGASASQPGDEPARAAGPDAHGGPSAAAPGAGPSSPERSRAPWAIAPPSQGSEDTLSKKLVQQKLFPGRNAPVTLGRFTVLNVLGQGGMGVVYACYDDQLERKVAVKVLLGKQRNLEGARARLLREAQAMARLSHPNIVTVLEVGTVDDQLYVAMEFVRGIGLDAWVEKNTPPWPKVVEVFMQAGRGLEAAHRAGIVHRDFKPQNVIITEEGVVKVLDFGLARATGELLEEMMTSVPDNAESQSSLLLRSLTRTGAFLGTPAYMSPEQHRGEKVTASSDQFSFCVALYQALYGQFPFSLTSIEALRRDVALGAVAPVPPRSSVPARILRTLRRGMAVEPRLRFASMGDLLAELARDPEARLRRAALVGAFAGAVGVAGFSIANAYAPVLEVCPDPRADLLGVWDPDRAMALKTAFLATGAANAGETWSLLEPQLDRYAAGWTAMRDEACHTHIEGRQSDKLFDLRTACLDQRRAAFDGLVDALTTLDATKLDRAAPAVSQLPSLDLCADAAALTAAIAPPEDLAARAQVQSQRELLARARAQENAGKYDEGLATVQKVQREAIELDYPPLLAEAAVRLGSLQMENNQPTAAAASLDEALLTAVTCDHKAIAAEAISKQMYLNADRLGQPAQALAELPLARAMNAHVKSDVDLYAEFLNNAGIVQLRASNLPEARRSLEAALALCEQHEQGDTALSLTILENLSLLAVYEYNPAERVTRARQLVAKSGPLLGEHHPWHIHHQVALAQILQSVGRPSEARHLLQGVEQALAATKGGWAQAMALRTLGDLEHGDLDHEERDLTAAKRHYQSVIDAPSVLPGDLRGAQIGLGLTAAQEGDEAAMRARFDALLTPEKPQEGAPPWNGFYIRMKFGQALLDAGKAPEAIEQFDSLLAQRAELDALAEGPSIVFWARYGLGTAYQQIGDFADAEQVLTLALDEWRRIAPQELRTLGMVTRSLGEVALDQRRFDLAVSRLREAEALYASMAEADYAPLVRTRFALARALTGDRAAAPGDAAALATQALADFKAKGPGFEREARAVEVFLSSHSAK